MLEIISSFHNIIREFNDLRDYLTNIDFKETINKLDFRNIDILTYASYTLLFLSILYILDNIRSHWANIFHKSNKYNTKKYSNLFFLLLYETIRYITQLPNLITLMVGIIQAIYASKFNNVIVTIACWTFAVINELMKYLNAKRSDKLINDYPVKHYKKNLVDTVSEINKIRAAKVKINDEVLLIHNDKTPSFIQITDIKYNNEEKKLSLDQIKDFDIGFYDDKESTGEEISKSFAVGDIIPPHRIMCRPDIDINGKIVKYVEPVTFEHQTTTPIFLNNVRFLIDLYAITLLMLISLFITASASAHESPDYRLSNILKHILATAIAGNVLIPSMRMTLLYNVYNLILSVSFISIKINSYDSFTNLENIKSVIFDKTGTITEEHLMIHNHYLYEHHPLIKNLSKKGWTNEEIAFAVAISNSESNILDSGKAWGTSPEENKILEYWFKEKKVNLIFNPIKSSGHIIFQFPDCKERKILIKSRHPYNFDLGKISSVIFMGNQIGDNIELIIRQHGTSRFIGDHYMKHSNSTEMLQSIQSDDDVTYDWAFQVVKNDKRRSMSIAIGNNEDILKWDILSVYTFDNPLRPKVREVINFFRDNHLPCSILTGDSRETAEDIAKNSGFPENIVVIKNEDHLKEALGQAQNHKISISIEGSLLSNILNETENLAELLLNNRNIFKIIYKASKNVKEHVVTNTNHCLYVGDAKNDELAIKNSYIGVCLSHGAETCRLYADICIKQPLDLIDLITTNGYKDMLLTGGQKIFKDVCFIGGLICGCLVVGIHLNQFEFLNHSLLYKDVWNPIPMMMISTVQYTTSVIGYASSNCSKKNRSSSTMLTLLAVINNLFGLVVGITISWFIKNYLSIFNFEYIILHVINLVILIKHSFHCIKNENNFGNQFISNSNKVVGFTMNIIDSISVRVLLYIVYSILF